MKYLIVFIAVLFIGNTTNAQKQTRAYISRSDSFALSNYKLWINNIDKNAKTLTGKAAFTVTAKINNLNIINIDLHNYTIDSLKLNGILSTNYIYIASVIHINPTTVLNNQDTLAVEIYYSGSPTQDGQWGGFYFNNPYAFQMGVGFTSQPHTVGRYLFPCIDNFVQRNTYEFYITTDTLNMAICNGLLLDSAKNNNTITWHWQQTETIPSYLVGIVIAPYITINQTLNTINGTIPALIACEKIDSAKVVGSFANLQQSLTMLETHFGPYLWSKVGYSLVPFSAGAMEHASNIHIGKAYINGNLTYETLIAHELSHHWFGNLVTCSTAEDMWLNEGFASFCELLHTEYVYGSKAYKDAYTALHYKVLSTGHIDDDGYRAISNMDSNYTYGATVYSKGAIALYTLRNYLGDSLFFNGLKSFLTTYKFKDITSQKLEQYLHTYTGKDVTNFFKNYIYQPGYSCYTIDSTTTTKVGSNWEMEISIRQRKHENINYYQNVEVPVTIYKKDFSFVNIPTTLDEQCKTFKIVLPFEPAFVCIDGNNNISDGSTSNTLVHKTTGVKLYNEGKARLKINSITNTQDSSLVRIEQVWTKADRFKLPIANYVLHNNRFWEVQTINANNITGYLYFQYNSAAANQYLDSNWLQGSENNIRLFYRKDARDNWQFANDSLATGASTTDKNGFIYCREIKDGEYALGINRVGYTDTITTDAPLGPCKKVSSINTKNNIYKNITIYPNPASNNITINLDETTTEDVTIEIIAINGSNTFTDTILKNNMSKTINLNLANGLYILQVKAINNKYKTVLLEIKK